MSQKNKSLLLKVFKNDRRSLCARDMGDIMRNFWEHKQFDVLLHPVEDLDGPAVGKLIALHMEGPGHPAGDCSLFAEFDCDIPEWAMLSAEIYDSPLDGTGHGMMLRRVALIPRGTRMEWDVEPTVVVVEGGE